MWSGCRDWRGERAPSEVGRRWTDDSPRDDPGRGKENAEGKTKAKRFDPCHHAPPLGELAWTTWSLKVDTMCHLSRSLQSKRFALGSRVKDLEHANAQLAGQELSLLSGACGLAPTARSRQRTAARRMSTASLRVTKRISAKLYSHRTLAAEWCVRLGQRWCPD